MIYHDDQIVRLRERAIRKIQSDFLPDDRIFQILLIGSSVKNAFGKYDPQGFRGSLFSDFDFIIFVEDSYEIPQWLTRELDGRPFPEDDLNLAYRQKGYIDNTYDGEIFFVRRSSMESAQTRRLGERAGIPLTPDSKHVHQVVYPLA